MASGLVIDRRFRGPPESANGGYACGLLARFIEGPTEVTLRAPPPLSVPLQVEARGEEAVLLRDGAVIAQARAGRVDAGVREPAALEDAERAASNYPWRDRHPYPTCFVCGPQRQPGDGLAIFPGPVDNRSSYAAPWTPDASLADADGPVRSEFVWAALDCPSGIVTDLMGEVGLLLLGRLTAELHAPLVPGNAYIVQAWPGSRDGRKLHTSSAVFSPEGEVCAAARAVWIVVRPGSSDAGAGGSGEPVMVSTPIADGQTTRRRTR